jgi:hypothetical protein
MQVIFNISSLKMMGSCSTEISGLLMPETIEREGVSGTGLTK